MASATRQLDFLILGGGIAGLTFALEVASRGRVAIFTVIVEDQPKVKCQWPGEVNWKLPEIGLSSGTNTLVVRGIDQWGKTLREERISVIKPAPLAAKP